MRSATACSSVRTGFRDVFDQGCAEFGLAVAAILEEEQHELPHGREFHAIDQAAAVSLDRDQPGPRENGEMGGQGVVRNIEPSGDLAGGKAMRLFFHEKPESLQPCGLGEGGKCIDRVVLFHMSGTIDAMRDSHVTGS